MTKIIPEQAREFAVSVVEQLQQAGYQALWAGGCVRDKFLGIEPKDYDVATNAVPALAGVKRWLSAPALESSRYSAPPRPAK